MIKKMSLSLFIILFFILIIYLFLVNNIHTVIPQMIYRSAQLSSGSLAYLIQAKNIKTVVNLRGINSNQAWYQNEIATTQEYGIKQYNLPWGAYSATTPNNLRAFIHILQTAPKPILIHCQSGADRTGLASALALIIDKNASLQTAEKQYSWRYLVIYDTSTGLLTMPYYKQWLQKNNLPNNKENLLTWINQLKPGVDYPCQNNAKMC